MVYTTGAELLFEKLTYSNVFALSVTNDIWQSECSTIADIKRTGHISLIQAHAEHAVGSS